jgi:hypothetical protein
MGLAEGVRAISHKKLYSPEHKEADNEGFRQLTP